MTSEEQKVADAKAAVEAADAQAAAETTQGGDADAGNEPTSTKPKAPPRKKGLDKSRSFAEIRGGKVRARFLQDGTYYDATGKSLGKELK